MIVNLEEALDLAMIMPYSPFSFNYKKRLMPYWATKATKRRKRYEAREINRGNWTI